ncbi:MAG TPA: hypothetical protein VMS43_13495 [Allosphingosinicella sp.]|nr:hypothetical protein [Allosphingosinicella sp.]
MDDKLNISIEDSEIASSEASATQNEFVLVEEELFVPALLQEC